MLEKIIVRPQTGRSILADGVTCSVDPDRNRAFIKRPDGSIIEVPVPSDRWIRVRQAVGSIYSELVASILEHAYNGTTIPFTSLPSQGFNEVADQTRVQVKFFD